MPWSSKLKIGCSTLLLVAAAGTAGLAYILKDRLHAQTTVEIPGAGGRVRLEWWCCKELTISYSQLVVISDLGKTTRIRGWDDWGPAARGSFYVTPEKWVVVLPAAGGAIGFQITDQGDAVAISEQELKAASSASWTYIGAVDYDPRAIPNYRFYSALEWKECIPMLGMKGIEAGFRFEHQASGGC
jgi:hypothetical protein